MCYLVRDIIWHKWRKGILAVFAVITAYGAIIEFFFPDAGLPKMKDILPILGWCGWVIIALVLLIISAIAYANQQRRQLEQDDNWIIAYKARHGRLPPIPKTLLSLVDNYIEGQPISRNIKLRERPSHQAWGRLTDENKERFLQIMDWMGLDRDDFLQNLRDTAPPGGSAITYLRPKRRGE